MAKKQIAMDGNDNTPKKKKEPIIKGAGMSGDEIKARLLEADSDEQLAIIKKTLRMEGVPQGSIDSFVARLKNKGELIFQKAVTVYGEGNKPQAVETIIRGMRLPEIVLDGGKEIFDAGVKYGMSALVAGVRLAQELSQMGISQASPVIRMAQELRAGAGESAREAGEVAAETALAGAIQYLSERPERKVDIATVQNPLMGIMARAMEPALTQAMSKMFSVFGGQPAQGNVQSGAQPQVAEQPQQALNLPTGWSIKEKPDKIKEKQDKEEEVEQ